MPLLPLGMGVKMCANSMKPRQNLTPEPNLTSESTHVFFLKKIVLGPGRVFTPMHTHKAEEDFKCSALSLSYSCEMEFLTKPELGRQPASPSDPLFLSPIAVKSQAHTQPCLALQMGVRSSFRVLKLFQ